MDFWQNLENVFLGMFGFFSDNFFREKNSFLDFCKIEDYWEFFLFLKIIDNSLISVFENFGKISDYWENLEKILFW